MRRFLSGGISSRPLKTSKITVEQCKTYTDIHHSWEEKKGKNNFRLYHYSQTFQFPEIPYIFIFSLSFFFLSFFILSSLAYYCLVKKFQVCEINSLAISVLGNRTTVGIYKPSIIISLFHFKLIFFSLSTIFFFF